MLYIGQRRLLHIVAISPHEGFFDYSAKPAGLFNNLAVYIDISEDKR